ncbi:phytoene/squalene synthase family protein [Luteolibacter algae]|uniref:Phytoene/squalene synthase family protein n=1 Tax=Luteolibacter algae TaxID=454151 RepID=A0ABW5D997_9BACT
MSAASEITRKAESNLAFALKILPKEKREDMVVFYAFCRTIDDLADDKGLSTAERSQGLDAWADGIRHGFPSGDGFGNEVRAMMLRRGICEQWLLEIIDGCRMDLAVQRFGSWEELSRYNWKVAGVVGLVSTRLFGCVHEDSDKYAETLGNALQLTNILRDVGEDLANAGRIYLPINDMIRFQYSERDLIGKVYDGRFLAMMAYQTERAEYLFAEAEKLIPEIDRKALIPARIMAETYQCLLKKLKADKFRVFDRRYSVSKARKLAILSKYMIAARR